MQSRDTTRSYGPQHEPAPPKQAQNQRFLRLKIVRLTVSARPVPGRNGRGAWSVFDDATPCNFVTLSHAEQDITPCQTRRNPVQITTSAHAYLAEFIFNCWIIYPYPYKGEGEGLWEFR